jgi:hypothetical protein
MSFLGLAGAIGTLLLLGGGISTVLLARKGSINVVEWICLSWLFGVCAISFLLWVGGNFLSGAILQSLVGGLALASAVFGQRTLARLRPAMRIPKPRNLIECILFAVLAIEIATIVIISLKHTLGWDGFLVWEIKARYAFLNGGVLPDAYFQGAGRSFSHPDYPLAIPLTQLWIYLWLGEANQFWAKIIFPMFYAVGAIVLALLGSRITGKRWIGLLLSVLLFFVPQASLSTGSAIVGYADFPLAILYLAAVGYLLASLRLENTESAVPIFATCLACLPWIKNEGAILCLVAGGAAGLLMLVGRLPRRYWLALVPGVVVAISWRVFLRSVQVVPTVDFVSINKDSLLGNLNRLPMIYRTILAEVSTVDSWGIFWLAAAPALLFLLYRWRYLTERLLGLLILAPLALYSCIYVFSAWHDYVDHVASSVPRLLMQLVPVTMLGIGLAVSELVYGNRRASDPSAGIG